MGLGLAVQVFGHIGLAVQVVELGAQCLRVGQGVVAHHHAGRFHQPGLDGIVQAKVRHHPAEQTRFGVGAACGGKRRGRQVKATGNTPGFVDAVQPLHPAGGLVQVNAKRLGIGLAHLGVGGLAVGVVRLVVDDHQVFAIGQRAQHAPRVGLVALLALFHHRALLLFQRHQGVPVFNQDVGAVELLPQRLGWAQFKLVVVIVFMPGHQHLQARLHRQARRHQENSARILARRLGVGQRVQHLPGDDHGHHRGLAAARGHLVAQPLKLAAIALDVDALAVLGQRLQVPDQRLDGFELAKVERPLPARHLVCIPPVLQQPQRDGRGARPAVQPPLAHSVADGVHQRNGHLPPRVLARVDDFVTGRAACRFQPQGAVSVLGPMLLRLGKR